MNDVYLLLGSNEGDRMQLLRQATGLLEAAAGPITASSVYETAAWGITDQPAFLNMVLHVKTALTPLEMLAAVQEIEAGLGRQREIKWGQRTIDIDILLYNSAIISLPNLRVPHPFLHERRFTLVPLAEIAPQVIHPVLGKSIQTLLTVCPDLLEVTRYSKF